MGNRKFYTCCFTGHRPSKLPWGYNEQGVKFLLFKIRLRKTVKQAIKSGVSGMALGSDILCAEFILEIKEKHPNIELECALPCINQTEKWFGDSLKRYQNILSEADKVTYVSSVKYFNGCMMKRNNYMIDNSSLLIAIYNGSPGGTKQTIEKAKQKGLGVKIIES